MYNDFPSKPDVTNSMGPRQPTRGTSFISLLIGGACAMFVSAALVLADPAPTAPEVEIKKHSTGQEATVRQGDKEWFIHVDVDQDRTMIIRSESDKGQEINNQAEIVDRPMSNSEVDHLL